MELAKNLAQWRDQTPEQWLSQVNRALPPVVVALLVILMAMRAASLTWQLLDSPADPSTVPPAVPRISGGAGPGGASTANLGALAGWRPFGEPPSPDAQTYAANDILDVEETSLQLTLHSALQVQDLPARDSVVMPEAGSAIISANRGAQKVYRTGQTIENANGAKLLFVFADSVRIEHNGRTEKLSFPPIDLAQSSARAANSRLAATPQRTASTPAPTPAAGQGSMLETMGGIASTLGQYMQLTAATENGQTIGYTINPRGDSQIFGQLGLEPGDILTEVNGIALTNVGNVTQILGELGKMPQASVTIRRNGVDQATVIDMSRLMQLSQSLQ